MKHNPLTKTGATLQLIKNMRENRIRYYYFCFAMKHRRMRAKHAVFGTHEDRCALHTTRVKRSVVCRNTTHMVVCQRLLAVTLVGSPLACIFLKVVANQSSPSYKPSPLHNKTKKKVKK